MSAAVERKRVEFSEKLQFLFKPMRYKVAYGGRGSGKSWACARALLLLGAKKKLRILCTREVQKSIKDSVHKLLSDQIQTLGLQSKYKVLETIIRGSNGTEFIFNGLSNETANSIKSFEGVDIVWCEEAQTITKRSWDILIPTIRKEGSEIWIAFNPVLDTDDTYQRFVINQPPGSHVCFINYFDNPWFSNVLEQERLHCKETDPDNYPNIWEGICRASVEGAIYAKEVELAVREGRIGAVPYDPRLKVHTVWDLGWNDSMFIILAQKIRSSLSVIEVIENSHKTLDWYITELQTRRYNWGHDYLPHDGEHKDFKTGKSARDILENFGRKVKMTPNLPVEDGIKIARMGFSQIAFDKTRSAILTECLKRYKRHINAKTQEPGAPVHDRFSHGADCFRYLAINADRMTNEDEQYMNIGTFNTFHSSVNGFGG